MAKGNKSSREEKNNAPGDEEAMSAAPDAGESSNVAVPEGSGEEQADPAPFLFESVLAGRPGEGRAEPQGQFSSDEMEFESWMFDAGDGRGIVMPGLIEEP